VIRTSDGAVKVECIRGSEYEGKVTWQEYQNHNGLWKDKIM